LLCLQNLWHVLAVGFFGNASPFLIQVYLALAQHATPKEYAKGNSKSRSNSTRNLGRPQAAGIFLIRGHRQWNNNETPNARQYDHGHAKLTMHVPLGVIVDVFPTIATATSARHIP
jgi:hypothetical protein